MVNMAYVAPHTGAWIETNECEGIEDKKRVAPHTGAWIETFAIRAKSKST